MESQASEYRVVFVGPFGDTRPVETFPLNCYKEAQECAKEWVQSVDPEPDQKAKGYVGSPRRSSIVGPEGLQMRFFREGRKRTPKRRIHAGVTSVGKGTLRWVFMNTDASLAFDQRMIDLRKDIEAQKTLKKSWTRPRKTHIDLSKHPTLFDTQEQAQK